MWGLILNYCAISLRAALATGAGFGAVPLPHSPSPSQRTQGHLPQRDPAARRWNKPCVPDLSTWSQASAPSAPPSSRVQPPANSHSSEFSGGFVLCLPGSRIRPWTSSSPGCYSARLEVRDGKDQAGHPVPPLARVFLQRFFHSRQSAS